MGIIIADKNMLETVIAFYDNVTDTVASRKMVNLGWKKNVYPDRTFVENAIDNGELLCFEQNGEIVAVAVVNYRVNDEYNAVKWQVTEPADKISTIHALAVDPRCWGSGLSYKFLMEILAYCKERGDVANHLDVIDSNDPALKLYLCTGYKDVEEIEMYYEVVGTRQFTMLEYVF